MAMYNEVVIEMDAFVEWMPRSVEAVWYLRNGNCYSGGSMLCEDHARRVHAQLLQVYGLTVEELPLLTFDLWDWKAPFLLAPSRVG